MIRRVAFPLACVASIAIATLTTSHAAAFTSADSTTISVAPDPPLPDQPFVLTAHATGVVGTPSYSWRLDDDRVCETPPNPSPDITLSLPRGAHHIVSCVTDDSGTLTSDHTVIVGPRPTFEADWPKAVEVDFVLNGLDLPIRWNVPTQARYTAAYSPASDTLARARIPLTVRAENRGTLTVLRISRPPSSTPVPLIRRRFDGFIDLRWDLRTDPLYALAGGDGRHTIKLLKPGTRPGDFGRARNPRISLSTSLHDRTIVIAIGAGAARGQTVTLRLITSTGPPFSITRRITLSGARTGVRWPIPDAIWSGGFAAVNLRAKFRRNGVVYSNLVPGGGQWRYFLWRP